MLTTKQELMANPLALFKSQFPRKFVNLLFTLVIMKKKLTDLCGN